MITFKNVSKAFDTLEVLHGFSLHIAPNQIVGVVGPSGSGKTTILKLITGIVRRYEKGAIIVDLGRAEATGDGSGGIAAIRPPSVAPDAQSPRYDGVNSG